jgi:hypothetical protein
LHRQSDKEALTVRLRVAVDNAKMQTNILKVVKCGEMFSVKSEKTETGMLNKRNLVLKELGGEFENEYTVSVLGNAASLVFYEGDLVVVTLRFQTREYNGQVFQDITVTDIYPLKK